MSSVLRFALPIFLLCLLPTTLPADPTPAPARELSAPVSEKLGALRELTDAKNYPAALAWLNPVIETVPGDSYDLAILSQIKAQIILDQGGPTGPAVAPLETALRLGDAHGYLDPHQTQEVLYLLAQLHYQRATESREADVQGAEFSAAAGAIRRWLSATARPGEDAWLLASLIYYNEATVGTHPAAAALREVLAAAGQGLKQSLQPKESLYLLILAAEQQLGETAASADLLELLVQRTPGNRDYWQQLGATYLALAGGAKDATDTRRYNLRALLTFERAQSHGFLQTPADNFNVAGLYFTLGQYDRAIDRLESGLRTGAIADEPGHWELLADACRQAHQETRALADLNGAAALHPADGRINYALARLDYGLDQPADARTQLEAALAKGHLDHPGEAALLLAYLDTEAHQLAEAARWLDEAARHPDASADDLARLRQALTGQTK